MMRVHIIDTDSFDGKDFPPETVLEAAAWFSAKFAQIPREYLDSARIEFGSGEAYGSNYARIEIYYDRPYSPEELAQQESAWQRGMEDEERRLVRQLEAIRARRGSEAQK